MHQAGCSALSPQHPPSCTNHQTQTQTKVNHPQPPINHPQPPSTTHQQPTNRQPPTPPRLPQAVELTEEQKEYMAKFNVSRRTRRWWRTCWLRIAPTTPPSDNLQISCMMPLACLLHVLLAATAVLGQVGVPLCCFCMLHLARAFVSGSCPVSTCLSLLHAVAFTLHIPLADACCCIQGWHPA